MLSTSKSRVHSPGAAFALYTAPVGNVLTSKPEQNVAFAGQAAPVMPLAPAPPLACVPLLPALLLPPDGAPPDGAPADDAPADDAPPDGAPPDGAPPDGAPPGAAPLAPAEWPPLAPPLVAGPGGVGSEPQATSSVAKLRANQGVKAEVQVAARESGCFKRIL